jgi:HCOMODA/2-hydroxy-3-carboxy-muconic semialdehyde decarboxylase
MAPNRSMAAWLIAVMWLATLMLAVPVQAATPAQEDAERVADLVVANRIIADQGVVDGFGHISVRSAQNPNHYFIARSRAPALVSADDIMKWLLQSRQSYLIV